MFLVILYSLPNDSAFQHNYSVIHLLIEIDPNNPPLEPWVAYDLQVVYPEVNLTILPGPPKIGGVIRSYLYSQWYHSLTDELEQEMARRVVHITSTSEFIDKFMKDPNTGNSYTPAQIMSEHLSLKNSYHLAGQVDLYLSPDVGEKQVTQSTYLVDPKRLYALGTMDLLYYDSTNSSLNTVPLYMLGVYDANRRSVEYYTRLRTYYAGILPPNFTVSDLINNLLSSLPGFSLTLTDQGSNNYDYTFNNNIHTYQNQQYIEYSALTTPSITFTVLISDNVRPLLFGNFDSKVCIVFTIQSGNIYAHLYAQLPNEVVYNGNNQGARILDANGSWLPSPSSYSDYYKQLVTRILSINSTTGPAQMTQLVGVTLSQPPIMVGIFDPQIANVFNTNNTNTTIYPGNFVASFDTDLDGFGKLYITDGTNSTNISYNYFFINVNYDTSNSLYPFDISCNFANTNVTINDIFLYSLKHTFYACPNNLAGSFSIDPNPNINILNTQDSNSFLAHNDAIYSISSGTPVCMQNYVGNPLNFYIYPIIIKDEDANIAQYIYSDIQSRVLSYNIKHETTVLPGLRIPVQVPTVSVVFPPTHTTFIEALERLDMVDVIIDNGFTTTKSDFDALAPQIISWAMNSVGEKVPAIGVVNTPFNTSASFSHTIATSNIGFLSAGYYKWEGLGAPLMLPVSNLYALGITGKYRRFDEFSPIFTESLIPIGPVDKVYSSAERELLLSKKINTLYSYKGFWRFNNNLTTADNATLFKEEHLRRLANAIARNLKVLLKQYVGRENTDRLRKEVVTAIRQMLSTTIDINRYKPDDYIIVCDDSNNTDYSNYLYVDIAVKMPTSVKYITIVTMAMPI